MTRVLVINGPNLNNLGKRDNTLYGAMTLADIESKIKEKANHLSLDVSFLQSKHEGAIVDWIQQESSSADGIIVNAGALTQVGYSLLDALIDARLPVVEVHISNIHAREEFRRKSVIAPYAAGQIAGLGWRGYLYALDYLNATLSQKAS